MAIGCDGDDSMLDDVFSPRFTKKSEMPEYEGTQNKVGGSNWLVRLIKT